MRVADQPPSASESQVVIGRSCDGPRVGPGVAQHGVAVRVETEVDGDARLLRELGQQLQESHRGAARWLSVPDGRASPAWRASLDEGGPGAIPPGIRVSEPHRRACPRADPDAGGGLARFVTSVSSSARSMKVSCVQPLRLHPPVAGEMPMIGAGQRLHPVPPQADDRRFPSGSFGQAKYTGADGVWRAMASSSAPASAPCRSSPAWWPRTAPHLAALQGWPVVERRHQPYLAQLNPNARIMSEPRQSSGVQRLGAPGRAGSRSKVLKVLREVRSTPVAE